MKIVSGDPVSYTIPLSSCNPSHFCSSLCLRLCTLQFEKLVVDQLKKKDRLLITRFGIDWLGSSVSPHSSSARKIELVGMKGSLNFFTIFLPGKVVQEPERNREGTCMCVY